MDRDGTISEEVGYVNHIDRLRLLPRSARAIRLINDSHYAAAVVTNQSGVARAMFPESLVEEVHERLRAILAREGARLDGIYYCPHHPDHGEPPYQARCDCRKPGTGMIEQAVRELGLDLSPSYMIGDKMVDVRCARAAGMKGVLVRTGYGAGEIEYQRDRWSYEPSFIADDLLDAVERILGEENHSSKEERNGR